MRPAAEPERYTKAKIFSEVGKKTEMCSHAEHGSERFIQRSVSSMQHRMG